MKGLSAVILLFFTLIYSKTMFKRLTLATCFIISSFTSCVNPVNARYTQGYQDASVHMAICYINSLHLQYDDVTDDNITTAILTADSLFGLSDEALQKVLDNYAD
jgi:hypothetical protein